ncbi:hypothetical protein [Martelella sp. AD-3]|uniref:hypothetical protein n=1 Tax=Martelella sp. AD-3 TaxID=686597 RepID=UPI0004663934|nr:hypothetical protein [Martelella sp. AD-3]
MKIECLIRRPHGSHVTLGAMTYHFKPDADDPRHIASVAETAHINTLLRISEGYRPVDAEDARAEPPARKLNGSTIHNQSYDMAGGDQIALSDLVDMAFEESGLDEDAWNALADQERYEWIDQVLKELTGGDEAEEPAETTPSDTDEEPEEQDGGEDPGDSSESEDGSDDSRDAGSTAAADTPDDMIAAYKKLFGRAPNKRMTAAQIKRAVKEA